MFEPPFFKKPLLGLWFFTRKYDQQFVEFDKSWEKEALNTLEYILVLVLVYVKTWFSLNLTLRFLLQNIDLNKNTLNNLFDLKKLEKFLQHFGIYFSTCTNMSGDLNFFEMNSWNFIAKDQFSTNLLEQFIKL